jgi:predicted metal-dependent HD superfamily phosphohydrolase
VDDDERVVRDAWRRVTASASATTAAVASASIIDDVIERHREAPRHYHTVTHVAWVLRAVDELLGAERVSDVDAVRVAAIFHDAIYDPRAADNEARSADLAVRAMRALGWSAQRSASVERLILATAVHEPSGTDDAVLLDADLSILGAPSPAYEAYVRAVREEYAHIDDDGWRLGRAAVLGRFLARDWIFSTPTARRRLEVQARHNLDAELVALRR